MKAMLACAVMAFVNWPAGASGTAGDVPSRIMVADQELRDLLIEGYQRSPMFRTLVDTVERSRWRVFIQRGQCPARSLKSCLLHSIGSFEGEPYLRILITVPGRRRHQVIGSLAHEIQHAVEVVQAPEVVDVATLKTMFTRIGFVTGGLRVHSRRIAVYETRAAEEVENTVRRELHEPSP